MTRFGLEEDLCARTSEKPSTLDYLDSIFDLSSDKTHWALGNHDLVEGNINYITAKTKRKDMSDGDILERKH